MEPIVKLPVLSIETVVVVSWELFSSSSSELIRLLHLLVLVEIFILLLLRLEEISLHHMVA